MVSPTNNKVSVDDCSTGGCWFPFLLGFLLVSSALAQQSPSSASTVNDGTNKCTPTFVPVLSVGCNRSNPIVCAAAAKSVFFVCNRESIAKVSDPDDAAYCSEIDTDCGDDENCQTINSVRSALTDILKLNIADFSFEVIAVVWMVGLTFMDKQRIKFIGLVVLFLIDLGLMSTTVVYSTQLIDNVPTYRDAECVDVISANGLKHHDALETLFNTAESLRLIGILEICLLVVCFIMDCLVLLYTEGQGGLIFTAILIQCITCAMAGVDLFYFTFRARANTDRAYGAITRAAAEMPLIDGLVKHGMALHTGSGDWCIMPSNETVTCLSSL